MGASEEQRHKAHNHTLIAARALLVGDVASGMENLRKALEAIQTLVETPFQELEIGDEFWNAGSPAFGVRFKKTGETQCLQLSGQHGKGSVLDNAESTWLVWKIIR